jgi:hypothetical protein
MKIVGGFYKNSCFAETGAFSVKLAAASNYTPWRVLKHV